jgi:hypothetical protein
MKVELDVVPPVLDHFDDPAQRIESYGRSEEGLDEEDRPQVEPFENVQLVRQAEFAIGRVAINFAANFLREAGLEAEGKARRELGVDCYENV